MEKFENLVLPQERALYGLKDALVRGCTFEGEEDGESPLKECEDITVEDCLFRLRYPFWHVNDALIRGCTMTDTCRAALWYDKDVEIHSSTLGGIKALRECEDVSLHDTEILSQEFGWMCRDVKIENCSLQGEYPFFHCRDLKIDRLEMKGKYSFQYVRDMTIRNSILDTKDAFWHTKNVTVKDSVIKGEYLGWYSKGLKLVRCKIIGTQPLCYCKDLVLEDCEMEGADFAFENSNVKATIRGEVISVKNPIHGYIHADKIGEIILDQFRHPGADCDIRG